MSYVWETDNLVKEFTLSGGLFKPKHTVHAVQGVSLYQSPGETLGIVGESGCGKSTFGYTLMGLHQATSGSIYMNGRQIDPYVDRKAVHPVMQMVFQNPYASLNPRLTVNAILEEPLELDPKYTPRDRVIRVKEVLDQVGLNMSFGERYAHELSGGQRQRIGIARALVMQPDFVIADEPISALDVSVRAQVLNLLKKFQKELGLTYLFIAHDLSVVRFISDRIAVIYKGVIVEVAETEELFNNPIHPYTQALLSAVPIPDPILERKKVLKVYDPSQHDYETDKPSMVEIRPGHYVWANQVELARYQQGLN